MSSRPEDGQFSLKSLEFREQVLAGAFHLNPQLGSPLQIFDDPGLVIATKKAAGKPAVDVFRVGNDVSATACGRSSDWQAATFPSLHGANAAF